MHRLTVSLLAVLLSLSALGGAAPAGAQDAPPHVLVWSGTYGFRHPSIADGQAAIARMALETGEFTVQFTENPADLNALVLQDVDVLVWLNSTGKPPFTDQQRDEIIRYAACGGGTIALHAAADSNYGWEDYADLIGAQFDSHPQNAGAGEVRVLIEQPDHPIVSGWDGADEFLLDDEFYRWRAAVNMPGISRPRETPGVGVLLSLDETTVADGIQDGQLAYEHHQPVAWTKTFRGGGRVYYNNMGHGSTSWGLPAYLTSIREAIAWTSEVSLDTECLFGDQPIPAGAPVPEPDRLPPFEPCPVPELAGRSGPPWETSGPAKVLTTEGDVMTMPTAGLAGGLGWGEQTYVLDLQGSGASTADVTFDLTWPVPTDDYDLSVTTAWRTYGSQRPPGTAAERVVIEAVPHCTILQVYGDNMAATSNQAPSLAAAVAPNADAGPTADPTPAPQPAPAVEPEPVATPTTGGGAAAAIAAALVGAGLAGVRRGRS